jgi:Lipocalin-like domain
VIIFKKLAHGFYLVIPTTTKSKVGSWYVPFRRADRKMIASLHQARSNETWTGTDQVRFFKLEGDRLTIKTAPQKNAITGLENIGVAVWERER